MDPETTTFMIPYGHAGLTIIAGRTGSPLHVMTVSLGWPWQGAANTVSFGWSICTGSE